MGTLKADNLQGYIDPTIITAPTPPAGNSSNRVATTQFVMQSIPSFPVTTPTFIFDWTGTPLTFVDIPHNLNKYPSVTIVDTSGNIVQSDVRYVSLNRVQIFFESPFAGRAFLN